MVGVWRLGQVSKVAYDLAGPGRTDGCIDQPIVQIPHRKAASAPGQVAKGLRATHPEVAFP